MIVGIATLSPVAVVEGAGRVEVCVTVFNPAPSEPLNTTLTVTIETISGTAGKQYLGSECPFTIAGFRQKKSVLVAIGSYVPLRACNLCSDFRLFRSLMHSIALRI